MRRDFSGANKKEGKSCSNWNWRQFYCHFFRFLRRLNLCSSHTMVHIFYLFSSFFSRNDTFSAANLHRCSPEKVPNWQSQWVESQQQSTGAAKHASLRSRFRHGELGNVSSELCRLMQPEIHSFADSKLPFLLFPFQYCRSIREQILSSFTHRNFSIMVVGNKFDLVVDSPNYSQVRSTRGCELRRNRFKSFSIPLSPRIKGTQGYFCARQEALEIGLCGVFSKVSWKCFAINWDLCWWVFHSHCATLSGTTTKWTTCFEKLWGCRAWMDVQVPE